MYTALIVPTSVSIVPDTEYIFSLRVIMDHGATLSTHLRLMSNKEPNPGQFVVTPDIGEEFVQLFTFKALYWTDDDLPLAFLPKIPHNLILLRIRLKSIVCFF